ncbi:GDSL-type esterase/lipase family protein [Vallitalea maricola]|uniref:Uncharacterized protein n=1 Tax=Vallitalea maricola TaxID=3074433 RepID=A0ACB5UGL4_9FIRM|nr:hypothetical protein AN2V17_12400 [Vallitalea sp. AN17-2]
MKQKVNESTKLIKKLADDKYSFYKDINQKLPAGGIVLLGDSLVQNFLINEMYDGTKRILNRGIFGSTTYDVINRLDNIVNVLKPETVVIWVGTNDFMPIVSHNTEAEIAKRIIRIADLITGKKTDTKILIISLLPVNQSSHPKIYHNWLVGKDNDKLRNTNIYLKTLCSQKNYSFLDLFDLFLDEKRQLRLDYTVDGIHINYAGYKIVLEKLKGYIQ